jgi:hypothetical protein
MAKYEGGVYSTQKKIFHSHELAKSQVKLHCYTCSTTNMSNNNT